LSGYKILILNLSVLFMFPVMASHNTSLVLKINSSPYSEIKMLLL
jgi:hypothetical protein